MVYDREKAGSDISDFVVSILSENLFWAGECMKINATGTVDR